MPGIGHRLELYTVFCFFRRGSGFVQPGISLDAVIVCGAKRGKYCGGASELKRYLNKRYEKSRNQFCKQLIMNLCENERLAIYFLSFAFGGVIYLSFLYKAYKHSKHEGYNPSFPLGSRNDFSAFFKECKTNYKRHNDRKLKNYFVFLHFGFAICVFSMLYFAFT